MTADPSGLKWVCRPIPLRIRCQWISDDVLLPPFSPPDNPPRWPHIPIDWIDWLFGKSYSCEVRCNVQKIDPCVTCPDRVTGTGTGRTREAACKSAQKMRILKCLVDVTNGIVMKSEKEFYVLIK